MAVNLFLMIVGVLPISQGLIDIWETEFKFI